MAAPINGIGASPALLQEAISSTSLNQVQGAKTIEVVVERMTSPRQASKIFRDTTADSLESDNANLDDNLGLSLGPAQFQVPQITSSIPIIPAINHKEEPLPEQTME